MNSRLHIHAPPFRFLLGVLLVIIVVLSVVSISGQYVKNVIGYSDVGWVWFLQTTLVEEFNVGSEANIPTYFSGLLLLCSSLLLLSISRVVYKVYSSFYRHWLVLSIIFAYISIDEVTSLHERLIGPLRRLLGVDGVLYFAWVIPAIVVLLLLAITYSPFFWHLPFRWKVLFAASGLLYVGGGLGFELLGGWYVSQYSSETFTYSSLQTIEEMLEMSGTALFLYSLLTYLSEHVNGIEITFQSPST